MVAEKQDMSSQVMAPNTEAAILARVLETDQKEMTPDVARYLRAITLPAADRERVDHLSEKARAASLTEEESRELDSYLHIGSLLGVLQSKARQLLNDLERNTSCQ